MTGRDGYDKVRASLEERGYLQGGIERFFLQDMASPGSPVAGVVRTALKAAGLGAPLLGGILALATVMSNRPLLGPADGPLIWVWLTVLAAPALFLLDLGAAGILAFLAGRRGALAGDGFRGALLVGVPLLAYLAVLWWFHTPGLGLLADAGFALAALAVAAAMGWLARFVSLAGVIGRTGQVPVRGRAGFAALAAVLLPLAAALVFLPRSGAGTSGLPSSGFVPQDIPGRLVFIGVDGLDGALVQGLAGGGAVERLLSGMETGAVFPIRRAAGGQPPQVWTTLLTGMPPKDHRVATVDEKTLPGVATPIRRGAAPLPLAAALETLLPARTLPATGFHRTVRTLWEIAGLKQASAAVGWWASWPAQPDTKGGYVVTDRVLPKLLSGAAGDRDTAPAALYARLAEEYRLGRNERDAGFRRWFGDTAPEVRQLLRESYLIDHFSLATAATLLEDPAVRSAFIYLPGLDILRTRLLARSGQAGITGILQAEQALERYVAWLDQTIGAGLVPGDDSTLVLVADPGRSATGDEEGFLLVRGPGSPEGCIGPVLNPLQVAPLVLRLIGFPVSKEMPADPPETCVPARAPVPDVATFGRRPTPDTVIESEYDPELVERLRSLGYIQ